MVRFISLALAAFATALHVVVGVRSENHPVWWHEHSASSPEKLQQSLRAILTDSTDVTTQANTAEARRDAEAQERTLREQVAIIRKDWQSASASVCHQQLGRVINNLTLSCEDLQPEADWLLDCLPDSYVLPNKTCADSVSDIFALGSKLVETLRVSRDALASLDVAGETLRRYQALSFVRSWLVKLTETRHHALLWAGFWDGDPENRTTKAKLFSFAKAIDHATVHPDSFLGQAIEASQDLDACYKDPQTNALAANMWSIASMSFVLGMRDKAQGTVLALVNKQITGERNLSQSVLSTHEIPTVGLAAWGLGFWSPEVIVVDLMGTCDQTSPALQKQLFARLPSWAKSMTSWSPEAFSMRSRLRWQCIDCSGACTLDEALAEHVEKLAKANVEQDRKNQELCEVVGCYGADAAQTSLRTEVSLGLRLLYLMLGQNHQFNKQRHLQEKIREKNEQWRLLKAGLADQERDSRERQLEVEQVLRRNADPKALNRFCGTALISAADLGLQEAVEALGKAGAQLEARDERGNTALILASKTGHLKVVKALVKAGAPLEARNAKGQTALIIAAAKGLQEVVEALVKAGAQLEARDEVGNTALILASFGHLKVVKALVKAGARLEARDENGGTALMFAAYNGYHEVVEVLVKAGAQLEARANDGKTVLIAASMGGHLKVVEDLVKTGAQQEARDEKGNTALMKAAQEGHLNVVDFLRKAGALA
ncbi:unnamed protein product [Symbiodinium sp. CCMP2456]|nr:unnamed protein product [Symbiodinium sp. CCMP2456]